MYRINWWMNSFLRLHIECLRLDFLREAILPPQWPLPPLIYEWMTKIGAFRWYLQFLNKLIDSIDACVFSSPFEKCMLLHQGITQVLINVFLIHPQTLILSIDFDRPSKSLRSSPELYVKLINTQMFDTVFLFRLLSEFDIFRSKYNPLSFRVLT